METYSRLISAKLAVTPSYGSALWRIRGNEGRGDIE
jgi:hypothetical protein